MIEIRKKWGLVSTLVIDEAPFRDFHQAVFGKFPKFKPPEKDLEAWFYALEYKKARDYALRRLVKESHCSFTLQKALKERCVSVEVTAKVIAFLHESALIDDEAWIENYVRSLQKRYGARAIVQKCYFKGIPKERLEPYLQEDETQTIKKLLETRYKNYDMSDPKQKQKAIRSLIAKGFNISVVLDVFYLY